MPANKSQVRFLFTLLAIVWGFLVGTNYLLAAWSAPTANPPLNNPEPFLTTGSNPETKSGILTLTNNFYVSNSSDNSLIAFGTTTVTASSSRLTVVPYTNASIDAVSGSIRTGWPAADDNDVVNKGYLMSTLSASVDAIKYWTLSGSNLYASSTSWNIGIGTTSPNEKLTIISTSSSGEQTALSLRHPLTGAGDNVAIKFWPAGGWTGMTLPGKIVATAPGSNNIGFNFVTNNSGSANTAFSILSGGNVGIGTTSPDSRLFVKGSGSASTTSALNIQNSSGVSSLFIRDDGYVGVGTTSPTAPFYVNGNAIADTPTAANHLATKSYVDTAAQSLWINSSDFLYASSTSWRVGIGTTSPASALHIYPRTDIEGLRIVSSNYSPLIISDAANNDLFRVNQHGDATAVTSSATKMRSNQYCDANGGNCFNPSSGWSTDVTTIFLTTTTTRGGFIFTGGFTGYDAGNKICNAEQAGSHFCRTDEIIYLIQKNGANSFDSINNQDAWMADGPPGYTGATPADDCTGWTNGTNTSLGHFWIFNSFGGGRGALIGCGTLKKITCCK